MLYLSEKSLGHPVGSTKDQQPYLRPHAHLTQNIVSESRDKQMPQKAF